MSRVQVRSITDEIMEPQLCREYGEKGGTERFRALCRAQQRRRTTPELARELDI